MWQVVASSDPRMETEPILKERNILRTLLSNTASAEEKMFVFLHTVFRGSHCKLSLLDIQKTFGFHDLHRLTSQKLCLFLKINDNRDYSG